MDIKQGNTNKGHTPSLFQVKFIEDSNSVLKKKKHIPQKYNGLATTVGQETDMNIYFPAFPF